MAMIGPPLFNYLEERGHYIKPDEKHRFGSFNLVGQPTFNRPLVSEDGTPMMQEGLGLDTTLLVVLFGHKTAGLIDCCTDQDDMHKGLDELIDSFSEDGKPSEAFIISSQKKDIPPIQDYILTKNIQTLGSYTIHGFWHNLKESAISRLNSNRQYFVVSQDVVVEPTSKEVVINPPDSYKTGRLIRFEFSPRFRKSYYFSQQAKDAGEFARAFVKGTLKKVRSS